MSIFGSHALTVMGCSYSAVVLAELGVSQKRRVSHRRRASWSSDRLGESPCDGTCVKPLIAYRSVVQYSGNGGTRLSSHQSSGLHPFCPTPPKYYNRKGASQAHCPRQLISDCVAEGANEYTDCTSIVSSSGSQFPQSSVLELAAAGIPSEKLVIGKFATVSNTTTGFMDPKTLGECVSSATQHGWSASLPELSPFWISQADGWHSDAGIMAFEVRGLINAYGFLSDRRLFDSFLTRTQAGSK